MIYYSYVHSIITYAIIFWGNSSHSISVFKIQKQIIRIMTNSRGRESCRQLFRKLEILPLHSQYILSMLLFVIKNKELFRSNQNIHSIDTRSNMNLHLPICNLTVFQKGVYFSGVKLFNHLPPHIKSLSNEVCSLKPALKKFPHSHSFYTIDEYFNCKNEKYGFPAIILYLHFVFCIVITLLGINN